MFWFKKSDVFVLPDRYFQPVLRDFWVKNGHIGTFYTKPATQENQEFDMSAWQNMQISLGFYAGRDTNPCHENSIFPPFAAAMSGAVFSLGNRKCAIVFPSHPTPPQPTLRKPHSTKGTMAQENPPQGCRNRRKARKGEAEDAAENAERDSVFHSPTLQRQPHKKNIGQNIPQHQSTLQKKTYLCVLNYAHA